MDNTRLVQELQTAQRIVDHGEDMSRLEGSALGNGLHDLFQVVAQVLEHDEDLVKIGQILECLLFIFLLNQLERLGKRHGPLGRSLAFRTVYLGNLSPASPVFGSTILVQVGDGDTTVGAGVTRTGTFAGAERIGLVKNSFTTGCIIYRLLSTLLTID